MKYLSDGEIIGWNDKLEESEYHIVPRYNTRNGWPDIIFRKKFKFDAMEIDIEEPKIKYKFSFSVIKKREVDFFNILSLILKEEIGTKIGDPSSDRFFDIELDKDSIMERFTQSEQIVNGRKFTLYTINFNEKLSSIMCYMSYIGDAISFFELIWGYDQEGNEVQLINFNIGDIVCMNNTSVDFIIIDLVYNKTDSIYRIDYLLSEIISDGCNIKYGDSFVCRVNDIIFSRNNRIDTILN